MRFGSPVWHGFFATTVTVSNSCNPWHSRECQKCEYTIGFCFRGTFEAKSNLILPIWHLAQSQGSSLLSSGNYRISTAGKLSTNPFPKRIWSSHRCHKILRVMCCKTFYALSVYGTKDLISGSTKTGTKTRKKNQLKSWPLRIDIFSLTLLHWSDLMIKYMEVASNLR